MITIDIRKSISCRSDLSIYVSFPYNQDILDFIRNLPSRYWHPTEKEWEIPFDRLGFVVSKLDKYEIQIKADNEVAETMQNKNKPIDYSFKTEPFQHQVDGFNYGLTHDRWLLGDEQGLGKTKQVIDIAVAKKLQRGYQHCLIICGVNGLKWNWVNEVATHSNESAWIIGQKTTKNKTTIGSNAVKLKQIKEIRENADSELNKHYFLITNVESLRDENLLNELVAMCEEKKIGMIGADEVHKMKNPQSQQGKGFLRLQAETMVAMTGTPLMNTPLDTYIILKWLGIESHSFYTFKNHYCIMGGYGNYQIVGYKHLENLQEQLNDIMLRRLKDDVLDLPEKTFINEYVEMNGKQEQIYKEIHNDLILNIDKVKKAVNPLSEMIRLRQATGYTGILSSTVLESAKLDRMEELVEDAVQNGKKVVIFSNWTQITDAVCERLDAVPYDWGIITGETADSDRQSVVNRFQNDPNTKVLIGTIGALGTGLTLTAGTVEIFLDEPWNMALKNQAIDRCHRIGQKNNIVIYTLLTKNTIDEKIHKLVMEKGEMSDMLIDGKIVSGKEDIVDFLLG